MLELNSITLRGGTQLRLDRVSVQFDRRWTAVVGQSGAGKTSLLNVLAGFETPDDGTVVRSDAGGRLPFYWVPQNAGLWLHLTADEHVRLLSNAESSDKLLTQFDLSHRRSARPGELSQGERARLAVARALASKAAWLFLDEPLSHVDPGRKLAFWSVLKSLAEEAECSVIFSSHEPETVLRHAENVVCLHEGTVAFSGSMRELYDSPSSRQTGEFLGPLNWFTADEAQLFLMCETQSAMPVRPEHLVVTRNDTSDLTLTTCNHVGLCQSSVMTHAPSSRQITILHRPTEESLRPGDRVELRVVR